jgi:hypothetical protein
MGEQEEKFIFLSLQWLSELGERDPNGRYQTSENENVPMTKTKCLHKKTKNNLQNETGVGGGVVLFLVKLSQFILHRRTNRILVESGLVGHQWKERPGPLVL